VTLHFEDFAVGDEFETGEYTVTKGAIVDFAEQFDPQPFHVDEDAAKESMFGELVASELHTLCLHSRPVVVDVMNGVANLGGRGMETCAGTRRSPPVTRCRSASRCSRWRTTRGLTAATCASGSRC